jgi:hypothetical protein
MDSESGWYWGFLQEVVRRILFLSVSVAVNSIIHEIEMKSQNLLIT